MLFNDKLDPGTCDQSCSSHEKSPLASVSASALLLTMLVAGGQSVHAQTETSGAGVAEIEEITVTGTRVVRDGYQAPTPTTVMGEESISAVAPINVADAVNMLPSLAGSSTPSTGNAGISGGQAGTNTLNLRGLGNGRTLVLLDGSRVVPQALTGAADINQFPDALVERVEIVTGGASAAYGSDAITGVVNFILNKDFTGVKMDVMGGVSGEGDNEQYKVSVTAGTPFASDRGHLLLSGGYSDSDGVTGVDRSWYEGWKIINNPDFAPGNGQPQALVRPQVALSMTTPGSIVIAGPLRGTEFAEGGSTRQFQYGPIVDGLIMQGGDWQRSDRSRVPDIQAAVERENLFGRVSYDLTDNTEMFAQLSYAESETNSQCCSNFFIGSISVQRDNAFLPEDIGTEMDNLGLTSLTLGSSMGDIGDAQSKSTRSATTFALGLNGDVDAFGSGWGWNVVAQRGVSDVANRVTVADKVFVNEAIDAVEDSNGDIVCRSTLSNPGNGCVPYNVLGIGVNSAAAIGYVRGLSKLDQEFIQDVASVTIQGDPFSTWAGPVSLAAGLEYRDESITSRADQGAIENRYFAANFKPTKGSFDVSEIFVETVVPLASGTSWAESLELNGAIRSADYSTAGRETTWKVGSTYTPVTGLTFRATRSRDIRAPNLNELFLGGQVNTQTVNDPFRGNELVPILRPLTGNLNLESERADTLGLGVVFQPSSIPDLSMSIDYYDIDIEGAIAVIQQQEVIDRCFAGNTSLCSAIQRDSSGVVSQVTVQPVNLLSESAQGVDIEASYRMELGEGDITFRGLATHVISRETDDGVDAPRELAGQGSIADWRFLGITGYRRGAFDVQLIGRYVSSGVLDNDYIECTSACPASSGGRRTIDNNDVDSAFYADLSFSYQLPTQNNGPSAEMFLKIDNIADSEPPVSASTGGNAFVSTGANPSLHDTLGRMFRAGVRLQW